jgi:hypothetical protein
MAGECLGSMRLRLLLQRPLRLRHRPPWVRRAVHAAAASRPRLRRAKQRRPLSRDRRHPRFRTPLPRSPPPTHGWAKHKIPPKIRFRKFVKLTDHTYAFKNLTSFEYEAHAMTRNGTYVNLQKLAWKNL